MSIVHSYSVGNGDMFSIRHDSDNCTIIDCNIPVEIEEWLLSEIDRQRDGKNIVRFISTHPDQDHICGLTRLDDHINILNFYVVKNEATKEEETEDFLRYRTLRDGDKAFYIEKACKKDWMNQTTAERGGSGINICWPVRSNGSFIKALDAATKGKSPNNISPVITYSLENGVKMAWFGDLETDFMEEIKYEIKWPATDILFAPHHGRESGKIPSTILEQIDPLMVVIGEAPSSNLDYYGGYDTITQNSAGHIYFECVKGWVHIYVGNPHYSVGFLWDVAASMYPNYIGSLPV